MAFALRPSGNEQILVDMENFSTPQRSATPWIANLATLAVVLAAIGWSSEQRPVGSATDAAATMPAAPHALPALDSAAQPLPTATQARWPMQTTAVAVEGVQVVGLQSSKLR
ncbi:MAG: hypothetical protein JNL87_14205 [Burkholderiaceae bacterium]|nr:hypothetical protein [Burkholderiaceae bacterium]